MNLEWSLEDTEGSRSRLIWAFCGLGGAKSPLNGFTLYWRPYYSEDRKKQKTKKQWLSVSNLLFGVQLWLDAPVILKMLVSCTVTIVVHRES